MLLYLNFKYKFEDFQIIEMLNYQQDWEGPVTCDGAVFVKPKQIEGKWLRLYKVKSTTTGEVFEVFSVDDNGKWRFEASYKEYINF